MRLFPWNDVASEERRDRGVRGDAREPGEPGIGLSDPVVLVLSRSPPFSTPELSEPVDPDRTRPPPGVKKVLITLMGVLMRWNDSSSLLLLPLLLLSASSLSPSLYLLGLLEGVSSSLFVPSSLSPCARKVPSWSLSSP